MRSTALFLSLFVSVFIPGCGSVFNGSSVTYKAPVLEPGHDVDAKGRIHCTVRRTGTEMTVALHGTPADVAHGFSTMNGGTFVSSGVFFYNCMLAEMAGTSVGGGSDDEALAVATETQRAFEDYLVEKAREGGGGQSSTPAAVQQEPALTPTTQPALQATPATAPAQPSAPSSSPAPVANLCQGVNGASGFADLASVYERMASTTADVATKAAYLAKVSILNREAGKPTKDQQNFQNVKNAMSVDDACQ